MRNREDFSTLMEWTLVESMLRTAHTRLQCRSIGRQLDEVANDFDLLYGRDDCGLAGRGLWRRWFHQYGHCYRYILIGKQHYRRPVDHAERPGDWRHYHEYSCELAALPVHHYHGFRDHHYDFDPGSLPTDGSLGTLSNQQTTGTATYTAPGAIPDQTKISRTPNRYYAQSQQDTKRQEASISP